MAHYGPPLVMSPRAMAGLRGAPVSGLAGLAAVPSGRRLLPGPAGNKPTVSTKPQVTAAGSGRPTLEIGAGTGGFKPKVLKAEDVYATRDESGEREFCKDDPSIPGVRPRMCRNVDEAIVRLKIDGPDKIDVMLRAAEDSTAASDSKNITFLPYNLYSSPTGSMLPHYAALYTLRKYAKSPGDNFVKPPPAKEVVNILETQTGQDLTFYDRATTLVAIKESIRRQQEEKRDADIKAEAIKMGTESFKADAAQAKADAAAAGGPQSSQQASTKAPGQNAPQATATSAGLSTGTIALIGGGVLAVGLVAFIALRR